MQVPLTVADFLHRAEHVYPDRIAFIDEPDQPATPLGPWTYGEMAAKARAQAAFLDDLGVPVGHVNVKAKTNEKLGYLGREEGINAEAVALLVLRQGA